VGRSHHDRRVGRLVVRAWRNESSRCAAAFRGHAGRRGAAFSAFRLFGAGKHGRQRPATCFSKQPLPGSRI